MQPVKKNFKDSEQDIDFTFRFFNGKEFYQQQLNINYNETEIAIMVLLQLTWLKTNKDTISVTVTTYT